jgi:hypothetical protein
MQKRTIGPWLLCLAFWLFSPEAMAGGVIMQSDETSNPTDLIRTNWPPPPGNPPIAGLHDPLVFNQFDSTMGKLTSIDVTMTINIRNDFVMTFVNTPIPTTIYLATSMTSDPSILSNPAKLATLTDGNTVTLSGPNGNGILLGPPATRQPVDFKSMTEPSGTWSSTPLPGQGFIAPTVIHQVVSLTLTAANDPSLFSEFIGKGQVDLPVSATAFSSFYSSSGNGSGTVLTSAQASVELQYVFTPFTVIPEPSSAILLGLGIAVSVVACRRFPRRAAVG